MSLLSLMVWLLLFILCWPLALAALLLWPLIWLISLPLAFIGIGMGAVLALIKTVLYLPARLLGYRG
jgi:hypothetical protein